MLVLERRMQMATCHIGKTVYLTNEMADTLIEAFAEAEKNPPPPRKSTIKWGDPKRIAAALEKAYGQKK